MKTFNNAPQAVVLGAIQKIQSAIPNWRESHQLQKHFERNPIRHPNAKRLIDHLVRTSTFNNESLTMLKQLKDASNGK